jgi:uncharacterized membrane protein HdeD (DUF308 family)
MSGSLQSLRAREGGLMAKNKISRQKFPKKIKNIQIIVGIITIIMAPVTYFIDEYRYLAIIELVLGILLLLNGIHLKENKIQ